MMGEVMSLWPVNTQITVAPAMNGRIWLNCESGVLPVMGLKRILEAIDAGEIDWEDVEGMSRWVKKQEIVLA
jgi:exosome complex RNA-binding protein Rrp4